MLKRILIVIFVLLILSSNVFASNKKTQSIETLDFETRNYYIDISKENITTKNIKDIFKNVKILKLYPNVSLAINDERIARTILNLSFFDVDSYLNSYVSYLNEVSLFDDAERVLVSGIKINKVYIESNKTEINEFIRTFKKAKILEK